MNFRTISIIGPGLLGGSIALSAKARGFEGEIRCWGRRQQAVKEVIDMGIVSYADTDIKEITAGADLIILCTPVGSMREQCLALRDSIDVHTIITDVGSVKRNVTTALEPLFTQRGRFIGSHPMAGSERTGIHAASADLFDGSTCVVTPTSRSDQEALAQVKAFWKWLGCNVTQMSPSAHDAAVAHISHLPHLVASALINQTSIHLEDSLEIIGNGFRDTTRIAAGSPEMWQEILDCNHHEVENAIDHLIHSLTEAKKLLATGDKAGLTAFLADAKKSRDLL